MIRIIIAGGRNFDDYECLVSSFKSLLKELKENNAFDRKDLEIVSGTANGTDKLGEQLAIRNDIKLSRFPADWDRWGKPAGYIRNKEMARYAQRHDGMGILLAFWDGKSRGTKHMIDLAKQHGLIVKTIRY